MLAVVALAANLLSSLMSIAGDRVYYEEYWVLSDELKGVFLGINVQDGWKLLLGDTVAPVLLVAAVVVITLGRDLKPDQGETAPIHLPPPSGPSGGPSSGGGESV